MYRVFHSTSKKLPDIFVHRCRWLIVSASAAAAYCKTQSRVGIIHADGARVADICGGDEWCYSNFTLCICLISDVTVVLLIAWNVNLNRQPQFRKTGGATAPPLPCMATYLNWATWRQKANESLWPAQCHQSGRLKSSYGRDRSFTTVTMGVYRNASHQSAE